MRLVKAVSLYTFVGFFNAGLSFLLMPYLSHFIDPGGYGILSNINSLVTIFIPLIGLTAAGLITVEYYKQSDKGEFARLFSSVQAIPVLPGVVLLVLAWFFKAEVSQFLELPAHKAYWVPLSVVIALLSIFFETLLSYFVVAQNAIAYTGYSVGRAVVEVGLTIIFVSVLGWGWEGRMWSWLLATVLSFALSIYCFNRADLLTTALRSRYIFAGIAFGLPLILHTLGKFVINQSDRIFITKMVSVEEAGIYNIGYQVGMVILLLATAIANFFQPFLFERLSNLTEKGKRQIVQMTYFLVAGLVAALCLLTASAPFLFRFIIDPLYMKGIAYVFWTGLGYLFWGVYLLFSGYIFYRKRTRFLAYLSVVNVLLNLILNYLLIRRFGALGATYATCISFLCVALIIVYIATRMYKLPWFEFKKNFHA